MLRWEGTTGQRCVILLACLCLILAEKFGKENIGLYRDDGLAVIKGTSDRLADKARIDVCVIFKKFGLRILAEVVTHQDMNFLDV